MSNFLRRFSLLLAVLALFAGVFVVTAQNDNDTDSDNMNMNDNVSMNDNMSDDDMDAMDSELAPVVQTGKIRVGHFAPDAPPVQIFVDGELSDIETLNFGNLTGWVELPAFTYNFAVVPEDGTIEDAVIGPFDLALTGGDWVTITAIGSVAAGTLQGDVNVQNLDANEPNMASITVYHGIETGTPVDVIDDEGNVLVSNLVYGAFGELMVPGGTYDLAVVGSGTTEPIILDLSDTEISVDSFTFVAAINTLADPQVVLDIIDGEDLVDLLARDLPTIYETAAADNRFDTLTAAIDAAGLTETLNSIGPFTVFAPTDNAFAALPAGALDALLANPDVLADVLLYHVVAGNVMAEDLTSDPATTVQGEIIDVVVSSDGIALNGTTRVIIADVAASNGTIHAIDSVLLPPSLDLAALLPTTDTDDDEDAAAPVGRFTTHLRVAHFAADAPAVQVYIDGELSDIEVLSFGAMTGWIELLPDTYNVAVVPSGGTLADAVIGPLDVNLSSDDWFTMAAIGSVEDGTLTADVVQEPIAILDADTALVTVYHGIEGAPNVDVIDGDGNAVVSDLAFGDSADITVPAASYDLSVVATGTTEPALLDLSGTVLSADNYYFVAAIGTPDAPQAFLRDVPRSEIEDLISKPVSGDLNTLPTILEIASNDDRFTTLVTAVEAAGLANILANDGPYTVFAPTNDAFAALPEGTLDSLLADMDALSDILLYHVVPGTVVASNLTTSSVATAQGDSIDVVVSADGSVVLNGSVNVIITDIQASNGVVHVIDAVLLPPTE